MFKLDFKNTYSSPTMNTGTGFYWFPVMYRPVDDKYYGMTQVVTCKDYFLDHKIKKELNAYFAYDANRDIRDRDDNTFNHLCIIVNPKYVPTSRLEEFQKLEENWGINPIKFERYEKAILITYDPIWETDLGLFSLYLSCLRLYLGTGTLDPTKAPKDLELIINEAQYYSKQFYGPSKEFYTYMLQNPLEYLKYRTSKTNKFGYNSSYQHSHGNTGPQCALSFGSLNNVFQSWIDALQKEKKEVENRLRAEALKKIEEEALAQATSSKVKKPRKKKVVTTTTDTTTVKKTRTRKPKVTPFLEAA